MSDLIESCVDSEPVFTGRLLHVYRDRVTLPDGSEGVREWINHPGAVVIVAELPDGRFLMEYQYRYPVGETMLEFPAGKLAPQEDPLLCAQRELLEETGYESEAWEYVGKMHPCIGYSNEIIHIYLARGLQPAAGGARLDEGEFLEVAAMSASEIQEAIANERLTDAKTITAWHRVLPRLSA